MAKKTIKAAYDYSEHEEQPAAELGDNAMARLSGLATEQAQAEARVAQLEADLATAKADLLEISEQKLPNLMDELGLADFTTRDGVKIEIKTAIRGSISQGNQDEAFAWLEEHRHGNLIKRQITIDFGKDQEKWADQFERDCARRKRKLNLKRKRTVAAPTLQAFVREQLEEGVPIPLGTFGVYRQRFSKVHIKD